MRGYAASAALTSAKCLSEAVSFRPNVVVAKRFLREADLVNFVESLRNITGIKDLPVVVYESIGQKVAGAESGMFRLSKEGQQIIQKVEDLLQD